ncbi:gamma-glutamyl-gamma-aminobutyrate hydrolase family protein [Candidatus Nomurabacteria bacterium]|uniref:Gamma-glutamyl-gamma-aminobutyrate hydrolase family protein n=1 Tax=candidate division WWE3 bacterium TaxID=2053526 RepID=A0A955E0V0_UNCKA|nr:gamma-glutamyl-gamma-aminobutyrate hydrolase family protein [candidate division WWE3 bacterium]MCB9824017.1 gamma-glutamyl-gamma-aminobutyrate hydrolase family protein [Candidatus Nomurabacteria bacterium]MCB9827958.1 gamma-glutamyl-gamma-aminobutyrate hydrolase family protein [Candidatus Nomurabacteria bacterium]HXK52746.1 gamma-glutamyl-gamma-aminobutyrate hydrolase family protein [bacterium]
MLTLLQYRTDQSGWHEVKCMYSANMCKYNEMQIVNVANPHITVQDMLPLLSKSTQVIIGGLGESGFEEKNPKKKALFKGMVEKSKPLLSHIIEREIPLLGVCFGHQLIAHLYGGEVVEDKSKAETGLNKITLNANGLNDPIFSGIDKDFYAIEGHKSSVVKLPIGAALLASSEKCEIQAYRLGRATYGLQFHSELDVEDVNYRLSLYPEYAGNSLNIKYNKELVVKKILKNFAILS